MVLWVEWVPRIHGEHTIIFALSKFVSDQIQIKSAFCNAIDPLLAAVWGKSLREDRQVYDRLFAFETLDSDLVKFSIDRTP
jgi:hypothetical protein